MTEGEPRVRPGASQPAHEIRRFESAVWSLFVLSDNPNLPVPARAACRIAAEYAAGSLEPGAQGVAALVQLAIEVGGGEVAPSKEALLARLREVGWAGGPSALDAPPPPLEGPPPRNLVSDQRRKEALDRIFAECERHLRDSDLLAPQRLEYARRLAEVKAMQADLRTKTERAWALLEVLERNLYARTRETGVGD
jgi:hypothetical protein